MQSKSIGDMSYFTIMLLNNICIYLINLYFKELQVYIVVYNSSLFLSFLLFLLQHLFLLFKMNKSFLFICLLLSLVCCVFQPTEARPLNLAKTAKKLLSILGTGTYYDVAAGVGSCGQTNSNDDMVVAVNHGQMKNGANPNNNPHCDKKVKIVGKTGKSMEARIVDTCPGCAHGCLDMSSACKYTMPNTRVIPVY